MSRDDFLRELRSRIGHLPKEEQDAAMAYYQEYFDECGDDAAAWQALGSPEEAAGRILSECEEKGGTQPTEQREGLWGWLTGLLSTPIWRPLLYATGVLLLVLALAALILLVLLGVLVLSMVKASLRALFISIPTALFGFGVAILCAGLTILAVYGLIRGVKALVSGIFLRKGA